MSRPFRFLCRACNRRKESHDGDMFCEECGQALKKLQRLYTLTVQAFPHLKKEPPGRAFARVVLYAVAAAGNDAGEICATIRREFVDVETAAAGEG